MLNFYSAKVYGLVSRIPILRVDCDIKAIDQFKKLYSDNLIAVYKENTDSIKCIYKIEDAQYENTTIVT